MFGAASGIKPIQNKNGVWNSHGTTPHCKVILSVCAVYICTVLVYLFLFQQPVALLINVLCMRSLHMHIIFMTGERMALPAGCCSPSWVMKTNVCSSGS